MTDEVITPTLADAVTAALIHARRAADSADAAATAATDVANQAEDIYRNFFYGVLHANPGTRPDLTPRQIGDMYYNDVLGTLKIYTDAGWLNAAAAIFEQVEQPVGMRGSNNLADVSSVSQSRINLGLGTAAVLTAGAANGVATLDSGGHVPTAQLPSSGGAFLAVSANLSDLDDKATARTNLQLGTAATKNSAAANGVASLDGSTKVPTAQLYLGVANGAASLDSLGHVPLAQLVVGTANGIATLDGSGIVPTSQLPSASGSPTTVTKSSDYTTIAGDTGKVIFVTTGSSTDVNVQLVGAATAGDGTTMIVAKADSGTKKVIVKDSDGTTQIAWLSTQYDVVCFRSNGAAWAPFWRRIVPRIDTYTANGTWTKPPLAQTVFVTLMGPGGGGGGGSGGGGGGGARAEQWFNAADVSATETTTVPSGGSGGGSGSNGGTAFATPTIFGTTARVIAGGGDAGLASGPNGGSGGGVGGGAPISSSDGQLLGGAPATTNGRPSVYGGGSGGGPAAATLSGGNSVYGGGGGGGGSSTTPGAGGKRGISGTGGGAGAGANGNYGGGGGGGGGGQVGGAGGVGGGGGGGGSGTSGGAGGRGEAIVTTVF